MLKYSSFVKYFQPNICFRDLSYNKIRSVPEAAVSGLPYLRILQLDNNKINCIHDKAFTGQ